MSAIETIVYRSPFGEMILGAIDGELCLCDWRYRRLRNNIDSRISKSLNCGFVEKQNPVTEQAGRQLDEYFAGKRTAFDIPLKMAGSAFRQKVWHELAGIPYGHTISYLELAQRCGDEKAIRAVAAANGANALSIVIPCHRVVGSNGRMTGYAGGIDVKRKLIALEMNGRGQMEMDFDF